MYVHVSTLRRKSQVGQIYCISKKFDIVEKTYGGKLSSKTISRSRDLQGQIQGQMFIKDKQVPTKKVMADMES